MKREDVIAKMKKIGTDKSAVLIEKSSDDIARVIDGKSEPAVFEYHAIEEITEVNNSIVIRVSSKGM